MTPPRGGRSPADRQDSDAVTRYPDPPGACQALLVTFLVTVLAPRAGGPVPPRRAGPCAARPTATRRRIVYYNQLYGFDHILLQYLESPQDAARQPRLLGPVRSVDHQLIAGLPKQYVLVLLGTIVSLLFSVPLGPAHEALATSDYILTGLRSSVAPADVLRSSAPRQIVAVNIPPVPAFRPQGTHITRSSPSPGTRTAVAAFFLGLYNYEPYMRSSVMDNLGPDYVDRAARAPASGGCCRGICSRKPLMSIVALLGLSLHADRREPLHRGRLQLLRHRPRVQRRAERCATRCSSVRPPRHAGDDPAEPAGRRRRTRSLIPKVVQLMAVVPRRRSRPDGHCGRRGAVF